jgi:hypothetical protein
MAATTSFSIVSLFKVTNGPIEFEALGFKFHGASGPVVLWLLCFLAVVVSFHLLRLTPCHSQNDKSSFNDVSILDVPAADRLLWTNLPLRISTF